MTTPLRRALIAAGLAVGVLALVPACGSSDESSVGGFCDAYNELNTTAEEGPAALFNADLDRLVETAPNDELRSAAETVRDGLASIEGVDVDNLDVNDPAALAETEAALEQVFTPEFGAAADQIDDYADANCRGESGS